MYIIYRRDYYKFCLFFDLLLCPICWTIIYTVTVVFDHSWDFITILDLIFCIAHPSYCLVMYLMYLRNDLNFIALKIDYTGMYLCSKKGGGTFVPWERIKYVIFVRDDYGSKIILRQFNKETHELILTYYFYVFRPKSAIKAAYKFADDKKKIREVKNSLALDYEGIMWCISKTEVPQKN